jgi:hypothetical protein
VEIGKTELAAMNENKLGNALGNGYGGALEAIANTKSDNALDTGFVADAVAANLANGLSLPEALNTLVPISPPAITAPGMEAAPTFAATSAAVAPTPSAPSVSAGTTTAGANAALVEHLAAAARKGIAGTVSTVASDAFMNIPETITAAVMPAVDMGELNRQAQTIPFLESPAAANASVTPFVDTAGFENGAAMDFQEAVRPRQVSVETLWKEPDREPKRETSRVFNIQNVNLNADEIDRLLDFARELELAIHEPTGETE